MKILIIDNFDSFTFNLVQYLRELKTDVLVVNNDESELIKVLDYNPDKILISPGPGKPSNGGFSVRIVKELSGKFPILGVCLGHQIIAEVFGGRVRKATKLMHGKTSNVFHDGFTIYEGIPQGFEATRYHSLAVVKSSLPKELKISSKTEDGTIMGLRHKKFPVEGIQFHPESILTKYGKKLLKNWIKL